MGLDFHPGPSFIFEIACLCQTTLVLLHAFFTYYTFLPWQKHLLRVFRLVAQAFQLVRLRRHVPFFLTRGRLQMLKQ